MALLRVTAYLGAPVVLRDALHLDAILTQSLAGRGQEADPVFRSTDLQALRRVPIPVAFWDGVPICSAAIIPNGARASTEWITGRKDGEDIDRMAGKVQRATGPGKDFMGRLPVVHAPSIAWLCWSSRTGNRSPRRQVLSALKHTFHVGSERGAGFGLVLRWEVDHVDGTPVDAIHSGGRARRHLPLRWVSWAERQDAGAVVGPYWHPRRREDRVPSGTPCLLSDRTLEKLGEMHSRSRVSVFP